MNNITMLQILIRKNNYFKKLSNASNNFSINSISRQLYKNVTTYKRMRLEPNNFQPRILKYLTNYNEIITEDKTLSDYSSQHYKPDHLRKVDNKELLCLINFLLKEKLKSNSKYYLHYLDKECYLRLPEITVSEIFNFLSIFMHYLPHKITTLQFYKKSIHMISFSIDHCSKIELLKLCFYVGLEKKSKQSQRILAECLMKINNKHLNNLNASDVAILCNSCYKTSTKIKYKPVLNKILEVLNNNLNVLNDPVIFIELVKSLRHNQFQNEETLTTISQTIFFNKTIDCYNFTACTHILALYADILFFDENLFQLLTNKCVVYLQTAKLPVSIKEHFSNQLRIKDIARFLWSLSYISYEGLDENVISNYIEPFLNVYITLPNFDKDIEHAIAILLSMYILGYCPTDQLMSSIITNNTVSIIYAKRKQAFITRLHLLLTCIKLEHRELFHKLNVKYITPTLPNIDSQLKSRPLLKKIYNSLNTLAPYFDINKIEYTFSISYLHIMGLTGYTKGNKANLYVELIDDTLLVRNLTDKANGFMNLKIRLLKTFRKNILVIFQSEIDDKTQTDINKYLEKKLKRTYVP